MCEEKEEKMDRARPLVRVMLSPVQVMLRPRREEDKRAREERAKEEEPRETRERSMSAAGFCPLGGLLCQPIRFIRAHSEDLISSFYHVTFHHHHSFII